MTGGAAEDDPVRRRRSVARRTVLHGIVGFVATAGLVGGTLAGAPTAAATTAVTAVPPPEAPAAPLRR